MKEQLRIGIVGCGEVSFFLAIVARFNRRIRAVACMDINRERASIFARKHKIPACFSDYQQMLDAGGMDAIYIAVPHHLHFPMIKTALDKGVHVFCEKPVTTTIKEALDICRISSKKDIKIGINYQYRYDSGCYALARAAQKGDLGQVYYGCCNVPWHRENNYFQTAVWRRSAKMAGGGTLITQASHALDILLWAHPGIPVYAQGKTARCKFNDVEVEDLAMGIIEMDDGSLIQVSGSMIATPEQPVTIDVYGSLGTGKYTGPAFPKVRFKGARVRKEKTPVRGIHAFMRSLEGFRRWVTESQPFLIPIEESLKVLAVITAIYKSAKSGKKEAIDQRYLKFLSNRQDSQ